MERPHAWIEVAAHRISQHVTAYKHKLRGVVEKDSERVGDSIHPPHLVCCFENTQLFLGWRFVVIQAVRADSARVLWLFCDTARDRKR